MKGVDRYAEENRKHHGGFDQAMYAYAHEDAQWWESELGIVIGHGRFGENLTTQGLDVTRAVIGERSRMVQILQIPQLSDSYRAWATSIAHSNLESQ